MCLALWLCLSKVQTYFMSKIIEEKNQRPQIYEGLAPFSAKPGPGDSDKCPAFQEHLRRAGRLAASHSQANRGQRHRVTRQVIQPVSTARLSRSLTRGSQHGEQRRDGGALPEPCPSRSRGSSVQGMNRGPTHSSAPGSEASHHLHFQQPPPTATPGPDPLPGSTAHPWFPQQRPRHGKASPMPTTVRCGQTGGQLQQRPPRRPSACSGDNTPEPSRLTGTSDEHKGHPLANCVATRLVGRITRV